jgi:hypothetical protein
MWWDMLLSTVYVDADSGFGVVYIHMQSQSVAVPAAHLVGFLQPNGVGIVAIVESAVATVHCTNSYYSRVGIGVVYIHITVAS